MKQFLIFHCKGSINFLQMMNQEIRIHTHATQSYGGPPKVLKMEMFRRNCFWRVRLELRKD